MDSQIRKRIQAYLRNKGLEQSDLEDIWGKSFKNFFRNPDGAKKPTTIRASHLASFAKKYKVDVNWLTTGEGINPIDLSDRIEEGAPMIMEGEPNLISAGYGYGKDIDLSMASIVAHSIGQLEQGYSWKLFTVDGISMIPTAYPADKLICKKIALDKVVNNRVYVVITDKPDMVAIKPDGKFIKRCALRKSGELNCKSDNRDSAEAFMTFRLEANEITEIWEPSLRITGSFPDPNRDVYDRLDELEERIEHLEDINGVE